VQITNFCKLGPVTLWQRGQGTCQLTPPLTFGLSENFLPKIQTSWLEIPEFKGKIKTLRIHISSVGNLQLSVGKL